MVHFIVCKFCLNKINLKIRQWKKDCFQIFHLLVFRNILLIKAYLYKYHKNTLP
jgi:hypothetical protein